MTSMARNEVAQPPEREQPRWGLWLCGIGLISAIVIVATMMSPYIRHEWKLALFRQSTPYTELAFYRPASLPVTWTRGEGLEVAFTITNEEGSAVSYRYVVASGSSAKLESLTSATQTVPPGSMWLVNVVVVPKCARAACRVQVSLPRQGEKIDFMFSLSQPAQKQHKSKDGD